MPPGHLAPECTCAPVATAVKVSKTAVHPSTGQQWKQKIRILLTFLNTAALLLVAADTGVVLTSVVRGGGAVVGVAGAGATDAYGQATVFSLKLNECTLAIK